MKSNLVLYYDGEVINLEREIVKTPYTYTDWNGNQITEEQVTKSYYADGVKLKLYQPSCWGLEGYISHFNNHDIFDYAFDQCATHLYLFDDYIILRYIYFGKPAVEYYSTETFKKYFCNIMDNGLDYDEDDDYTPSVVDVMHDWIWADKSDTDTCFSGTYNFFRSDLTKPVTPFNIMIGSLELDNGEILKIA